MKEETKKISRNIAIDVFVAMVGISIIGIFFVEERSWIAKWWISVVGIGFTGFVIWFLIGTFLSWRSIGVVVLGKGYGIAASILGLGGGVGGAAIFGCSLNMILNPDQYIWNVGGIVATIVIAIFVSNGTKAAIDKHQ